jgi:hypothetical protein
MRFRVSKDGPEYELRGVQDVSLLDLIRLQSESAALGKSLTVGTLNQMRIERRKDCTDKDGKVDVDALDAHPHSMWLMGTNLWASRRLAGEDVSFADALGVSYDDLTFIPDEDDEPAESEQPDPPQPPSGQDGGSQPEPPSTKSPATTARRSGKQSVTASS